VLAGVDRVHGGQELRLFNAYYDDYGFQPIVVFDAEGRLSVGLGVASVESRMVMVLC
jgi:hypothetical protein